MLKALECGVKGVSLSGTGPSFVALLGDDKEEEERLRAAWHELKPEGKVIKRRINNRPILSF